MFQSTQIIVIGLEIISGLDVQSPAFWFKYCQVQLLGDLLSNFRLDGKYVFDNSVVTLGPEV